MATRELTYDEKKAAEAAFRGLPCDPKWSAAARKVYEGVVQVMDAKVPTIDADEQAALAGMQGTAPVIRTEQDSGRTTSSTERDSLESSPILDREEAVQAGLLVDVTPFAQEIGINLPVGMSKSLWEVGITASNQVESEHYTKRVRDVLMALRLHIETSEVTSPWIKFPALLSFPPEAAPQLCSLYAVAHKDETTPYSLTLLLPHEMSSIKPADLSS